MKVIGINGSPRKQWNTATLVTKALEGAVAQGAETELARYTITEFVASMTSPELSPFRE